MENMFIFLGNLAASKKCILYGAGTVGRAVGFMLQRLAIPVAYYVDQDYLGLREKFPEMDIKSPYDLMYEKKEDIAVLICTNNSFVDAILDTLMSMGLEKGKGCYVLNELCAEPTGYFDPMLGYSRKYNCGTEELYGFALYGDRDAKYKIIALGGSTTDDTLYGITSWPEALYGLIGRRDVCILNGGIVGYDSSQELMKLIRDCIPLCPNLVVSFSGVNEKAREKKGKYPYASVYLQETLGAVFRKTGSGIEVGYGVENTSSAAKEFVRNQTLMHAICRSMQIGCVTILQPDLRVRGKSYYGPEDAGLEGSIRSFFSEEELESARDFFDEIDKDVPFSEDFVDGRGFLEQRMDVFLDWVHVNEEGNRIIAGKIYDVIKDRLPEEGTP